MPILDLRDGKTQLVATQYRAMEYLEEGRFAEVYRAHYKRDGIDVALKVYKEPVAPGRSDDRARKEYDLLKRLAELEFFPSRASFITERFDRKRHHILIMELGEYRWEELEDGEGPEEDRKRWRKAIISLEDVVPAAGLMLPEPRCPEFWQPDALADWVGKLCEAVRLMHERRVLHLDLKPANILLKRAAGETGIPFLVDFNTSAGNSGEPFSGGTPGYQAPEVKAGVRKTPDTADDLYSLALILWEMHFGLGARDNLDPTSQPHALVPYQVDSLRSVLLRALDRDPSQRYATAAELKQAVTKCLHIPAGLSNEEMAYIRKKALTLRENIEEFLAGKYYLHVSKAKRDEVGSLFSNLSTETTDGQDLRERLLHLGPKAIPAIFEEGYKLDPASPQFITVVDVLAELGRLEQKRVCDHIEPALKDRALGSIDQYCLSSTYVVRRLCRELCSRLQLLPAIVRESLLTDQMIYLPEERDELADLILRLGRTLPELRCLFRYLYGEYIEDPGFENYKDLRDRVADRLAEMHVPDRAGFLAEQAYTHAWEDLEAFRAAPVDSQNDLSGGLLQLLADAFASLGDEALLALQQGRVRQRCKTNRLRIWRTFAWKLCQRHTVARDWLRELTVAVQGVPFQEVQWVRDRLAGSSPQTADVPRLFAEYLRTGQRTALNGLVWSGRLGEVLGLAAQAMDGAGDPVTSQRILDLLRQCHGRERTGVLNIAFQHYETFAALNYGQLLQVVCQNGLPAYWMRQKAAEQLETDIERPERSTLAQEWLDDLLGRE